MVVQVYKAASSVAKVARIARTGLRVAKLVRTVGVRGAARQTTPRNALMNTANFTRGGKMAWADPKKLSLAYRRTVRIARRAQGGRFGRLRIRASPKFRRFLQQSKQKIIQGVQKIRQLANTPTGRRVIREIREAIVEELLKEAYERYGWSPEWQDELRNTINTAFEDTSGNERWGALPDMDVYLEPEFKEHLGRGFKKSYDSQLGYHVEIINGQKVMFVRGTRPIAYDWAKNIGDALPGRIPGALESKKLDIAARIIRPDVVVGHSRGGHVISRMTYGKADGRTTYVGYDAAMRLSRGNERRQVNFAQDQPFDRFIGRGGLNNHYIPYDYRKATTKNFHRSYNY